MCVYQSQGGSGQGEAERTNSAIGDSVVDGSTIEWEMHKTFKGMTEDEVKKLSAKNGEKMPGKCLKNW